MYERVYVMYVFFVYTFVWIEGFFWKFPEEVCFRSGFQAENPTSYLWNTLEWLVMKRISFHLFRECILKVRN
jgi:hypothetical protein